MAMKILLEGTGPLKEYLGDNALEVEMLPEAIVADLYPLIEARWGSSLPAHLWNSAKQKFRGAVVVVINGTPVQDIDRRLNHGDHVQLVKALTGG
jgi:hypothetical protein